MKKLLFFAAIVIVGTVLFAKKPEIKTKIPLIETNDKKQDKTTVASIERKSIFIPEWTIGEERISDNGYDRWIYFGADENRPDNISWTTYKINSVEELNKLTLQDITVEGIVLDLEISGLATKNLINEISAGVERIYNQAKEQNDIEQELKNFAVGTLAGYHSAVGQLDAFNAKIMVSSPTTPVTIGGVRYNSSQEYWRFKRDSYVSDQSPNGMFARLSDEQKTALTTKLSSNTLTNADITATSTLFDSLIHRPELATYAASIMNAKQDVIQSATDAKAKQIYEKYATSLDAKKAVADLNALKALGGNVEGYYNKILLEESQGAFGQMSGIIQEARRLIDEEGLTMQQALDKAAATQVTLSPEDLLKKTPKELASESLGATKKKGAQADQGALLTPEGDPINDLSSKYGIVGKTVYDKATGKPFMNEQEFFTATGLTNFKGVTFDTSYKPPAQAPSATPSAQPVQPTEPQTPAAFDTVTATSDDYLAIANLAWVLSGSAKQQQAQYGSPDIGTFSGNRASYMKAAQDVAAGRTTGNRELDNAMNQAIQKYSQTKQPSPQAPTPAPTQPQAVVPQQKAPSPAQAPAKQQAAQQQSYTVASGDTLSAISKRLLGDANRYAEIAKLNKIADPNKINPGQKLIIPNK